ncbi:MAG: PqqD family protein, partial [Alphaproteobacteria bacterium]
TETTLDDDVFLVEPGTGEVFYLNAVTSGLWTLFATPTGVADAAAAYREAFPDEPADKVSADVRDAVADMRARELIVALL